MLRQYTLRVVDFAGDIEYSTNQCLLTKRSLYLLVWNVTENIYELKEWLDCLVAYVPDSYVIIVGTHADKYTGEKATLVEKLNNLLDSEQRYGKLKYVDFHLGSCVSKRKYRKGL